MSSLKNQKLSLQTDTYNAILDIYKILFDFNKNDKQDILKRISDLDALITKYEKELEIIEEEFKEYRKENSIKNNSNSKEFQEYEDKLRNIKNILRENIRRKNAEETIIKSFLYRVRKAFYNIISNERIQAECNKYIESFNNNTLKEVDDIESSLEKTLYKVSSDIDTNLTLMNAELESDLEIYFKAKDKNFG
jgi:chromosome segregation ATPase